MELLAQDVYDIANEMWEVMFKSHLVYGSPNAPCDLGRIFTAYVNFSGSEHGAVVLEISEALARQAAANMLSMAASDMVEADMQDAVRELVNIIGSHVKTLLAEACRLSIPKSVADLNSLLALTGNQPMLQVACRSGESPLRITVLKAPST